MEVLISFLDGKRSKKDIKKRAELLESREDIEFDEQEEELIDEIIHI